METGAPPDKAIEEELVRRIAKERDERALRELMFRCKPKLTGHLKLKFAGLLRDPEIDQAVTNTFYNFWRSAHRFDPSKGTIGGWLLRIAQRAALSILRGESRHSSAELVFDPLFEDAAYKQDSAPESTDGKPAPVDVMLQFIEDELTGFERVVARTDVAAGGTSDSKRLAREHGKTLNTVYVTRNKVRAKLKKVLADLDAKSKHKKGNA